MLGLERTLILEVYAWREKIATLYDVIKNSKGVSVEERESVSVQWR